MAVNTSELVERFRRVYPGLEPCGLVRAPGRVNLIGEHIDYNDGCVLPMAMSQALYVVFAPAEDDRLVVHSTAFDQSVSFPVRDPGPPGEPAWANYVRGVAAMLGREGIVPAPGRLLIHSEVPVGGGVSSSAALEVGTARALLSLAGRSLDPVPLALLARQAEHEYARSPCGIMDQFICVLGRARHALLLDCRSRSYEHLPIPDAAVLMVMNTQVKHEIGASEYPVRQRQCREGLAVLNMTPPLVSALRDVTMARLAHARERMDPVVFRRCRHVVTEQERTEKAAAALRTGDLATFGRLMGESHESLRDDYEVSCEELDALVDIARELPGAYGARMTGGGFGGCAIALIRREAAPVLREEVRMRYDTRFPTPAIVYPTCAADGASVERW